MSSGQAGASTDSSSLKAALLRLYSDILDAVIPVLPPRPPSSAPPSSLAASQYAVARSIVTRLAAPLEEEAGEGGAAAGGGGGGGLPPGSSSSPRPRPPQPLGSTTPSIPALASILPDILRLFAARAAPVRDEEIQRLLGQALDLDRDALNNSGGVGSGGDDAAHTQSRLLARLETLTRAIQAIANEMLADIRTHHRKRSDASTASQASLRPASPLDAGDAVSLDNNSNNKNVSQESLILTAPPGTAADQFRRHVQSDLELSMQRNEVYAIWGGSAAVKANWDQWLATSPSELPDPATSDSSEDASLSRAWRTRLLETVFSTQPIHLPSLPTRANLEAAKGEETASNSATPAEGAPNNKDDNTLPYALIAGATPLFNLQNRIQAVIVLACLVAVVNSAVGARSTAAARRPPRVGGGASQADDSDRWVSRLWTLLEDYINEPDRPAEPRGEGADGNERTPSTTTTTTMTTRPAPAEAERSRLQNLTAECIRAYRELRGLPSTPSPAAPNAKEDATTDPGDSTLRADMAKIETGVKAALRYDDPVFQVLRRRLFGAFVAALNAAMGGRAGGGMGGMSGGAAGSSGVGGGGNSASAASGAPSSPKPALSNAGPQPPSPHGSGGGGGSGAPPRLATGRRTHAPTSSSTSSNPTATATAPQRPTPTIPGFARPPLLADKVGEVLVELEGVCRAIVKVWGRDLGLE